MQLYGRRLYLPAISIILVVILLLGIIAISTYRNWHRERRMALTYFHGQGLILIRALEAGLRLGTPAHPQTGDSLTPLIREMADAEEVSYIHFYDDQGRIVHQVRNDDSGQPSRQPPADPEAGQISTRIRKIPDRAMIYEMAKTYRESDGAVPVAPDPGSGGSVLDGGTLVLGLDMARYEISQKEDLHHALVMGGILLALGSGVIFFIFVIQNYYIVNRGLKASRDFNHLVVSSMADGLISIDAAGRILSHNQRAATLLGQGQKEMTGKNLGALIDLQATGIQQALTRRYSLINREVRHPRSAEETVVIGLTMSPLGTRSGQNEGAVLVLRDLTQVKHLARKVRNAEKLAAVGALAAGVAHEIRNPLSSIRGFAQFFRHRFRDQPQEREYAGVMVREIDRINGVVTNLLHLARPGEPVTGPTRLKDLLEHALRLVSADARNRQVSLELKCAADLPEVNLDGDQITQALLNLLLNALQASESGGRVVLGARSDEGGRQVVLWVADNGPGIPPENLNRIFEPFFTTRTGGTGLGLAIVNTIVTHHGGRIQVKSPLEEGSGGCRITLWLPKDQDRSVP